MNREQVASGLLALLAVLALGGVAATLDTAAGDGAGAGAGAGDGTGVDSEPRFSLGGGLEQLDPPEGFLPNWARTLLSVVVLLVGIYGTYELYREYGARQLVTAATVGVVVALVLYGLLSLLRPSELGAGSGPKSGEPSFPAGGGGSAADTVSQAVDPPTALLAALGLVLLGAVAVIVRASGDQRVDLRTPDTPEPPSESDVAAVADAAGRAADRLDAADDLENAVYRSWHEMTAHLDVERPDASTPAEFADAAVDAGMDRDDVAELTRLFEAVRYGDAPATAERAERATAALRRIERTYGDGLPAEQAAAGQQVATDEQAAAGQQAPSGEHPAADAPTDADDRTPGDRTPGDAGTRDGG
ncbi:DUF4129 domain-containing protein [Haloglomus halophilum]|uniref:DUF4129 domain-containing protein n=1 Tax=Haloglomus halophilum TaxID=2962672 RepID=UPI0020C94541|nr:DUF4129 domain-containing protein [Haloglomus halophilum]